MSREPQVDMLLLEYLVPSGLPADSAQLPHTSAYLYVSSHTEKDQSWEDVTPVDSVGIQWTNAQYPFSPGAMANLHRFVLSSYCPCIAT